MSKEEADDERRLHECARNYEEIVKQFDDLIEMMNNRTRPPVKRRRLSSSCRESSNASVSASPIQADNNEVFVQTIAKFLDNLQPKTDADCSKRRSPFKSITV